MTLQFLAAGYLDDKSRQHSVMPVLAGYAIILMCFIVLTGYVCVQYYPRTLGNKQYDDLGEGDFTLDMYGWKDIGTQFSKWAKDTENIHRFPQNNIIVCDKWFPAAHIDYYIAQKVQMDVIGIGTMNDLHQYYWLNHYRNGINKGDSALCIIPSNYSAHVLANYLQYFNKAELLHNFPVMRGSNTVRYFNVFLLCCYKANDEMHITKIK